MNEDDREQRLRAFALNPVRRNTVFGACQWPLSEDEDKVFQLFMALLGGPDWEEKYRGQNGGETL
jgi:hypothetical protein